MKRLTENWAYLAVLALLAATPSASAVTITAFNFEGLTVAVNNSPSPTVGAGTATPLGMTNNFTAAPSITTADVLNNPGSSTPSQAWRIRANGPSPNNGNGWHSDAPQYSQGAEFLASTVGYKDIVLTYDWSPTTQGVKHQQVQYTADGSNWTNIGPLQVGPASESWVNGITIDMSSIPAVNNNANFGVRMVSAYAPDGPNAGNYVALAGGLLTNTSGNWRLDSIAFSGNAIPEPSSVLLIGLAVAGWALARRGR